MSLDIRKSRKRILTEVVYYTHDEEKHRSQGTSKTTLYSVPHQKKRKHWKIKINEENPLRK